METTWVPYALGLALANVLALCTFVPLRRRREFARQGSAPSRIRPEASRSALEDDPLESLVREVESAEAASRFGAPGERSLSEDIRRWRARHAAGSPLPQAASSGRGGSRATGR